jgi:UDP-MurNAc hydroxylase
VDLNGLEPTQTKVSEVFQMRATESKWKGPILYFINHACIMVETKSALLLIDPWLEGLAFNSSWSLLDDTTSNKDIIDFLKARNKQVHVWVSHEHGDHFSTSFFRQLSDSTITSKFYFQHTKDKRVISFVANLGLESIELATGQCVQLDKDLALTSWSFYGDCYCLIEVHGRKFLNLNDCDVNSSHYINEVKRNLGGHSTELDLLFTQFGYANWIGNSDQGERQEVGQREVIERLKLQIDELKPSITVPFASFSYFSHFENFYMNNFQNTPHSLRTAELLTVHDDRIVFMRPWQEVTICNEELENKLREDSKLAESHWNLRATKRKIQRVEAIIAQPDDVLKVAWVYLRTCQRRFGFLPVVLSLLGLIPSLKLEIYDLKLTICLSYHRRPRYTTVDKGDIILSSETASVLLSKEYGFDTCSISARFQEGAPGGYEKARAFFRLQKFIQQGLSYRHPVDAALALSVFVANRNRDRTHEKF